MKQMTLLVLALVYVLPVLVLVAWEDEKIVGDAAGLEVGNLDSRPEESHLDAQLFGYEGFSFKKCLYLLDASLSAFLLFQRQQQSVLV